MRFGLPSSIDRESFIAKRGVVEAECDGACLTAGIEYIRH